MKSNPNELADQTPDASALSKFAVAFVFCSAILTLFLLLRPLRLQLTLDLSASRPSIAQLFYDVGAGFNEKDSGKAQVHAENPGQFETLSFSLPNATVVHLRFDPTTNDEGVVLRNVGISDGHKSLVKIPLSNLLPLNQIQDRTQQANQVILKPTPAANDPSIELKLRSPIDCKRLVRHYRRLSILLANGILLLCMGGGFYLSAFLSKLTGRVAGTFGTGHRYFARVAQRLSVPGALELDSYCIWFYAICALGFLIFSAADLNGSSIGVYSTVWGNGAPETSWIGSPRLIRSDEWAYATPDILHQVLRAEPFDVRTSARGGYSIALLDSVPVKHFTTIFRPQFWGFFVLPLDYGYAFYWQFKWLILITGVFTWLRFLTRSTFWSICGSLWFFWSPFTQWSYSWSTRLPEMIGEICWLMVLVCVISVERRTTVLIMAGLGIVYGAIDFALC